LQDKPHLCCKSAIGGVPWDRKCLSATEYAAMVVDIAALVVGGAQLLGGDISTVLNHVVTYLITTIALWSRSRQGGLSAGVWLPEP
jgi:Flp pilus assembly pilin Flp